MAQEAHDSTGNRQSRRRRFGTWPPRRSLIGAIAVMVGVLAANQLDRGIPEDMRKIPGAAKAFSAWTQQREYPFRDIPDAASYRAFEYSKQHLTASQKSLTSSPWVPIGPHNLGGRTLAVAISPDDGDVVYAGSASGGLWKSTTGGIGASAWQQVPTGLPVLAVSSIALVAGDPSTIYIGSGEVYNYQNAEMFGEAYRSMRGSYGIGLGDAFRLDLIADTAAATDEEAGFDNEFLAGVGLAGNFIGPWSLIIRIDGGVPVAGPDDGFTLFLAFLKLFR